MKNYLKGVDGLRAICALIILLGHIPAKSFTDWTIISLPLPVCVAYVFFVISGFLAGNGMANIVSSRKYLIKKVKRIFPLYFSYILVSVVVFVILHRSEEIINSRIWYYLLILPSIPFCKSVGLVPLVHLWFIGSLFLFYLAFSLFAKLCYNKGDRNAIVCASIICLVWFSIKMICRFVLGNNSFAYRFVSVTCFDVFFVGVIGGIIVRKHAPLSAVLATIIMVVSWLLLLLSSFYGHYIPAPIRIEYIAFLSLIILISQQKASSASFLDNKIFRWLASISYEIYVTQILVIILLSSFYTSLNLIFCDFAIYLVSVMIVLVCSWIWNLFLGYVNRFLI